MPKPLTIQAAVWQGVDALLVDRIRSVTGDYVQRSDIQSVSVTVYDADGAIVVGPLTPSVASTVFNTLQPYDGVLWAVDRIGYNFLYRLAGAAAFPEVADYVAVVTLTMTDDALVKAKFELSAEGTP